MSRSRSLKNVIVVATVAILAAGGVWAEESANRRTAGMMRALPAESLFCVRINNFDGTLDAVNEFLKDVAPESLDAKTALLSKLGGLLGDNELKGVNKKGNIAIFGLNIEGESAAPGPMGNMFIGALLPVTKYENFISRNPNCGEPDEQGISTITVNGGPMGLATNFRRYALLCPPNARENLIKVKKLLTQRKQSLGRSLDADERKQAASSPIWIYLNVKQGSQMIQPMLFGGIQMMKAQLEKAKESGESPMPIDPSGIINFYGGIFKMVLDGTENVTVALAPSAEACSVTVGAKAVPETEMAAMVGNPIDGDFGNKLGYLDDGAMMNIGSKIDRSSMKAGYMKLFELVGLMIPDGIPEADLEEMKTLTTEGINALGDSIAISIGVNGKGTMPFWAKYVFEVEDEKAFKEVLEKELHMMEDGAFGDLYKGFGMEMNVKINRGAGNYKGVTIDAAKVNFKISDKSMQSQMIGKMFGDGLDYSWAFVNNNCVYTIGGDADKMIRELIDQVKAGGPKKIGAEMKAAMDSIPDSKQADVVGTFNYVRAINMAMSFMIEGADSQDQVQSQSSIAFAGRTTENGKVKFQMVLPKKHLQEIQSVFKKFIPLMEKQQREQREKQRSEQS